MQRAARMNAVKESAIIKVAGLARALKAEGKPVIGLSIGVPGFKPPMAVYDAARAAVDQDSGDYLPGRGAAGLVTAFRDFLARRGFEYAEAEVAAQVGGKGALFNIFLATLNEGDKVAIPAPYWASYPDMVKLAGGEPVIMRAPATQDYKISPDQLRDVLAAGDVKMFIFNNPSNPTGMLYTPDEVAALAEVLLDFPEVMIISDDIYDKLVFVGEVAGHLLHTAPALRDRMIMVQSISKTYGMPGWRAGFVAGPKSLISDLLTLTSQSFTNVPGVVMAAAEAALRLDDSHLVVQKARLLAQRDMTLAALREAGLPCPMPEGAFYAFPQVRGCFGKTTAAGTVIKSDEDFCTALLNEAFVAVVPGGAFGDDGAIRISYAGNAEELKEALARLVVFVGDLR